MGIKELNGSVIPDLDPQSFTSDKQRDLLAYWLRIKGDLLMPSRKALNPSDIPHLLSAIWMADVIDDGQVHFKVRLFGTELVSAFQFDSTNLDLGDIHFAGEITKRLANLVKTRQPYYIQCDFPIESEVFKYYTTLTLPMSSDKKNVDIVLSCVHFFS